LRGHREAHFALTHVSPRIPTTPEPAPRPRARQHPASPLNTLRTRQHEPGSRHFSRHIQGTHAAVSNPPLVTASSVPNRTSHSSLQAHAWLKTGRGPPRAGPLRELPAPLEARPRRPLRSASQQTQPHRFLEPSSFAVSGNAVFARPHLWLSAGTPCAVQTPEALAGSRRLPVKGPAADSSLPLFGGFS